MNPSRSRCSRDVHGRERRRRGCDRNFFFSRFSCCKRDDGARVVVSHHARRIDQRRPWRFKMRSSAGNQVGGRMLYVLLSELLMQRRTRNVINV